ncbi:hypothetical protein KIW84_044349 [Lathyrus oleraceus]|uniref:Reverse transcriptase n=1 Tax=Pisum sativum TaxID=3888 RepID=A0A9D4XI86_PEA|nr:hypothetical protein KIW84_044349 [Pisum sativum]
MDQLGPKALRTQGANESLITAKIPSYPPILLSIPEERHKQGNMELKMDEEDAVYASPREDGKNLWHELVKIVAKTDGGWLLGRDFNDIKEGDEKRGGDFPSDRKCALFHDSHGGLRVYERLDKDLSNEEWRLRFPDAQVCVLTKIDYPDHHPILVSFKDNHRKSMIKGFKFEYAWILKESFKDMIQSSWKNNIGMLNNLEEVRVKSMSWHMHTVQSLLIGKKFIIRKLECIQRKTHESISHDGLKMLEYNLQQELQRILYQEELTWFQRANDKWLADGNRNTCFYHVKAVETRRHRNVQTIKHNKGKCLSNHHSLLKLAEATMLCLYVELTFEDIKLATFEMAPLKSSNLDGFAIGFFHNSWEIVGGVVFDYIRFYGNILLKLLRSTLWIFVSSTKQLSLRTSVNFVL